METWSVSEIVVKFHGWWEGLLPADELVFQGSDEGWAEMFVREVAGVNNTAKGSGETAHPDHEGSPLVLDGESAIVVLAHDLSEILVSVVSATRSQELSVTVVLLVALSS